MENEMVSLIISIIFMLVFSLTMIRYYLEYNKSVEPIDGVKILDTIQYKIRNTTVEYVMYKLSSTCMSKVIESKEFEKVGENEGLLIMGPVKCTLINRTFSEVGATYRVQVYQSGEEVILILEFIENRRPNVGWPSNKKPDIVFSQAYHRFFKEQFDVVVLPKNEK